MEEDQLPRRTGAFREHGRATKEQRHGPRREEWKRNHPLQAGVHQFMKDNNLFFHSPQERAKMKQERKATMEKGRPPARSTERLLVNHAWCRPSGAALRVCAANIS